MNAYVRRFDRKESTEKKDQKISAYFPPPMTKAFWKAVGDKGAIRDSDYVLGPIYSGGDMQIGVTGGVAYHEAFDKAVSRELGEEIGLVPKRKEDLNKLYKNRTGKKIMQVYDCFINDTTPVLDHQHSAKITTEKDTPDLKVGCFVYGTKSTILKFLNQDKIYVYHSDDNIVGIGAIKVSDVWEALEKKK